jgi:branched-chain amino acid transport system substrate-binding protein
MTIATLAKTSLAILSAALFASGALAQQSAGTLKLGIVTFLSGPAAGPFGVPARNAAELAIEALNAGALPPPYATKGINGLAIEAAYVDEAGGTTKQVTEYRNLVQRQNVDVVIGYISSGDCLAVAPLADELKKLTIFFDCGTPRIFEDASYKYLFRTGPHAAMDNVAAARYLLATKPNAKVVAAVNQNYAWGQDSWNDFKASIQTLKPDIRIATEQFPKLGAGQYGAEISALLVENPDVIHSSFWGGDMEAFILQGRARGVFDNRTVILTAGETAMYRLASQIPDGTVIGGRGPHGVFAPDNELNRWFRKAYIDQYGAPPTYPAYKMVQAILGLKAATEKAAGGKPSQPATEAVIAAFEGLTYETPSGKVEMKLGKGHQAVQAMAYGTYKLDAASGKPTLVGVVTYPADCVNPPEGAKSEEWIRGGFKGAKCD